MITEEQFNSAQLGEIFEAGSIFQGVTSEPILFVVQEKTKNQFKNDVLVLGMIYFDTDIGNSELELADGKVFWRATS